MLSLCSSCAKMMRPSVTTFLGSSESFLVSRQRLNRPLKRFFQSGKNEEVRRLREKNRDVMMYVTGGFILAGGLAYAAVPLYRMFCQATAYGGTVKRSHDTEKIAGMKPISDRKIKIRFNADVHSSMQWLFKPLQREIMVHPGETALAFYTATNPTSVPIVGISTYNIVPFEAGLYFNKIQCFCFEEQILNPGEQVDMPVFFYIDPDFANDPGMEFVDEIMLSYTFFEAKGGIKLTGTLGALVNAGKEVMSQPKESSTAS